MNFKVLLVGDGGVGKTSWLAAMQNRQFSKGYVATLGIDVRHCTDIRNNKVIDVWDTAGQEKFEGLGIRAYGIGGQAAIVMFDVSSKMTFRAIPKWVHAIRRVAPGIPILLCGNKADIPHQKVSPAMMAEMAETLGIENGGVISVRLQTDIISPLDWAFNLSAKDIPPPPPSP